MGKRVRKYNSCAEYALSIQDILSQVIEMLSIPSKEKEPRLCLSIASGQSIRDAPKKKVGPTFMPERGFHFVCRRWKEVCYNMVRERRLMLRPHKAKGIFSTKKGYGPLFTEVEVDPNTYPVLKRGKAVEKTFSKHGRSLIFTSFGYYPYQKGGRDIRFLVVFNGVEKNCVTFGKRAKGRTVITRVELDVTTIPESLPLNAKSSCNHSNMYVFVKPFDEMFPVKRNAISRKPLMHATIVYEVGTGWRINTEEYSFDPTERTFHRL